MRADPATPAIEANGSMLGGVEGVVGCERLLRPWMPALPAVSVDI